MEGVIKRVGHPTLFFAGIVSLGMLYRQNINKADRGDRGASLDRVDEAIVSQPYYPYYPYLPYAPAPITKRTNFSSEGVRLGLSQK